MSAAVVEWPTVRFRCSTCRKSWANKRRAQRHVAEGCVKDPDRRACGTCKHDFRGYPAEYEEPGADPGCEAGVDRLGCVFIADCEKWERK